MWMAPFEMEPHNTTYYVLNNG